MDNLLVEALLIGAAAWRIAALISYERGPFDIFLQFRKLLGFQHNENGEPTTWPDGIVQKIVSCVWCIGIYSVVAMWGLWQISETAVLILAASTIVVVLEQWNRRS